MSMAPLLTETPSEPSGSGVRAEILRVREHLSRRVLGQPELVEKLLVCLLADGHLLVEGAPGLAKTTAVKALGEALVADFQRVQFTPDLLPADITGTDIFQSTSGSFSFEPGPIFHNLILADEINRAPAKVQSALLEAMAERQVTVGRASYPLPELFLVMATQNPIEQEGTYPLPEAQLDRFLLHVRVGYPGPGVERAVLRLVRDRAAGRPEVRMPRVRVESVLAARREVLDVHLSPSLEEYLTQLVVATRDPSPYDPELARFVRWGASPRGTLAIDRCARARAWLEGRSYALPEDLHAVAIDALRHRVRLGWEAEAAGVTPELFLRRLLARVPLA